MRVIRGFGWLLLILGAVAAAVLGVLAAFPVTQTRSTYLLYYSTFIPMVWIPAAVAIVGLTLVLRGRWRFLAAVPTAVALLVWGLPVMPRTQDAVADMGTIEPQLGVFSANARFGLADVDQILAQVDPEIDVLAFQEYTPEFEQRLRDAGVFEMFPYMVGEARPRAAGTAVLSRVPVEIVARTEELPFDNLVATLNVDGRDWYVASIHSTGPHFGAQQWADDGDAIIELMRPYLGEAAVFVGDYNAIEEHYPLRRLADAGFRNALDDQSSRGLERWQPTWRVGWVVPPFARIDHAYLGERAVATVPEFFEIDGTDHKALRLYLQER
ncbi:MAG TPA: endonuclease/exonuclease/phosphatase family protein [Arachnia sp.]|nr:endonuclease/exonuclease/phosphatase family protein [Arachnia sp.]HMT85345.1 endonuclease/exonuclease/phosphatase family protein [Arachnia sp.]